MLSSLLLLIMIMMKWMEESDESGRTGLVNLSDEITTQLILIRTLLLLCIAVDSPALGC